MWLLLQISKQMSLIKENTFKQLQFNIPDATEVLQDLIKIPIFRFPGVILYFSCAI